jgi:N6-adenosine-specific RNA methylase IME4
LTYDIIYADPPWDYKGQTKFLGNKKTSEVLDHYPTLTLNELKQLPVPSICSKNCLLFMWSSSPHLDQAIELMVEGWGFDYKTIGFVWDKQKVNPGFYTLSQVEVCLVGKRGRIPQPRGARNVRQFLSSPRGEHSAKPHEVRRRIEEMFPTQKKLEMFARSAPAGWDVFGNDIKVLDNTISLT